MPQFALPFKYEEETKTSGLTGLAGLPPYIELLHALKMQQAMRKSLDTREDEDRVWKPSQIALTLVLLNLAGGEHVEDFRSTCQVPTIKKSLFGRQTVLQQPKKASKNTPRVFAKGRVIRRGGFWNNSNSNFRKALKTTFWF
jgi:hypothetical protein